MTNEKQTESKTPRTDKLKFKVLSSAQSGTMEVVMADEVAQIEQELKQAREELEQHKRLTSKCIICGKEAYRLYVVCADHKSDDSLTQRIADLEKVAGELALVKTFINPNFLSTLHFNASERDRKAMYECTDYIFNPTFEQLELLLKALLSFTALQKKGGSK